jgi:hypothetical protein
VRSQVNSGYAFRRTFYINAQKRFVSGHDFSHAARWPK